MGIILGFYAKPHAQSQPISCQLKVDIQLFDKYDNLFNFRWKMHS